ncbi:murein L,D-transpeptidase [Telmatospirillum sp. J64-1]|uniref:L,D-transpeptidase family protein n=1 Tax=Telmatospirillum sp. J64-1 TaxID=2502183 RepID=UPI00115F2BD4|nr:L,D-transpeptidase family protein [Telmatospirillum sp. J64-1]
MPFPRLPLLLALFAVPSLATAAEQAVPPPSVWNETTVQRLADTLSNASMDGLNPQDYPLPPEWSAARETALETALLTYAADLSQGRVRPHEREDWRISPSPLDPNRLLAAAAMGGDVLAEALNQLAPPHEGYRLLRQSLIGYQQIAENGGWPQIPDGPPLRLGTADPRLDLLRERLRLTGDLSADAGGGPTLDTATLAALKSFQARHGLPPDGQLGPRSLAALNIPVEQRIAQITANLERWRWLPRHFEPLRIEAHITDATVRLIDHGTTLLSMRSVVGHPETPTPSLIGELEYIVVNPPWFVPDSITAREILPEVRKDPFFLAANNMSVLDRRNLSPIMTPIDWNSFEAGNFPYRIRQEPGPDNSLGQIKFHMKDGGSIFLHDTPERHEFALDERALSHGCVRVEKPVELAAMALDQPEKWTSESLHALIGEGKTRWLKPRQPIAVYLFYWTAWVDEDGRVQFREDIYGRDEIILSALTRRKGEG